MNIRQEGHNPPGKMFCSIVGNGKAVAPLFSLLLCLPILISNFAPGRAQTKSIDLKQRLEKARTLDYHTCFLRRIAKSSPVIEVAWTMEDVFQSLRYIAENGSERDNDAAKAVGSIFSQTEDERARKLCLSALKKIGNKAAMKEIARIHRDPHVPAEWRAAFGEYLPTPHPQRSKGVATSAGSLLNVTEPPQFANRRKNARSTKSH